MTSRPGRLDRRHMGQAGDLVAQVLHERAAQLKQEARERLPVPTTPRPPRPGTQLRLRWPLLPGDLDTGSVPRPRSHRARPDRRRQVSSTLIAAGWLLGTGTNVVAQWVHPIGDVLYCALVLLALVAVVAGTWVAIVGRRPR